MNLQNLQLIDRDDEVAEIGTDQNIQNSNILPSLQLVRDDQNVDLTSSDNQPDEAKIVQEFDYGDPVSESSTSNVAPISLTNLDALDSADEVMPEVVDKFATNLASRAESKSVGRCAKYVRQALDVSGLKIAQPQPSAYLYENYLSSDPRFISHGTIDPTKISSAPVGSIIVYSSSKSIPHGHIQAMTKQGWCSDFKQKSAIPGTKYRNELSKGNIHATLFTINV